MLWIGALCNKRLDCPMIESDRGLSPAQIQSSVQLGGVQTPNEPIRTCVGCRRRDLRSTLWRLVLAPEARTAIKGPAQVIVDEAKCLPGRGAWLHAAPECMAQAQRRRAVTRALRVDGPVELGAVWERLARVSAAARTQ